jgi:hypothetical protein
MDYTPGIFEGDLSVYGAKKNRLSTTLAGQLALYVTMYSPLVMAADLPQNYRKHPDAFQFIKDVAVDWRQTRILEAEPGDYVTIARQSKRDGRWFVGGKSDENARTVHLKFDFLEPDRKYSATLYRDAAGAHWLDNPKAYQIETFEVDSAADFDVEMAPGGGFAMTIAVCE